MISKINVVAAAIIVDHKLLVARRSDALSSGGLWELPGGKVERNETDQAALVREIQEELGLAIVVQELVCTSNVTVEKRKIRMRVYRCRVKDLQVLERRVHSEFLWADVPTINQLSWAPADVPILSELCFLLKNET